MCCCGLYSTILQPRTLRPFLEKAQVTLPAAILHCGVKGAKRQKLPTRNKIFKFYSAFLLCAAPDYAGTSVEFHLVDISTSKNATGLLNPAPEHVPDAVKQSNGLTPAKQRQSQTTQGQYGQRCGMMRLYRIRRSVAPSADQQ